MFFSAGYFLLEILTGYSGFLLNLLRFVGPALSGFALHVPFAHSNSFVPSVGIICHLISSLTSLHLFKKYLSPFFF